MAMTKREAEDARDAPYIMSDLEEDKPEDLPWTRTYYYSRRWEEEKDCCRGTCCVFFFICVSYLDEDGVDIISS
jgi:hypothetical protein